MVIEHHAADAGWAGRAYFRDARSGLGLLVKWAVIGSGKEERQSSEAFLRGICSYSCANRGPQVPGIVAIVCLADVVDIDLVVSMTACPSQQICPDRGKACQRGPRKGATDPVLNSFLGSEEAGTVHTAHGC